ncbi:MAG: hypothetical protein MR011_06185 [Lachnospiraceae bacterium]|nr:hypothetical protein [Lachnospiraceae bacterium]
MTNFEAIGVLKDKFSNVDIGDRSQAEVFQEAFDKARDALVKLDLIKTHGCAVCSMSKEYDCNGCAFLTVDEGKDPCRMCMRNCKDYFRRAKKNAD